MKKITLKNLNEVEFYRENKIYVSMNHIPQYKHTNVFHYKELMNYDLLVTFVCDKEETYKFVPMLGHMWQVVCMKELDRAMPELVQHCVKIYESPTECIKDRLEMKYGNMVFDVYEFQNQDELLEFIREQRGIKKKSDEDTLKEMREFSNRDCEKGDEIYTTDSECAEWLLVFAIGHENLGVKILDVGTANIDLNPSDETKKMCEEIKNKPQIKKFLKLRNKLVDMIVLLECGQAANNDDQFHYLDRKELLEGSQIITPSSEWDPSYVSKKAEEWIEQLKDMEDDEIQKHFRTTKITKAKFKKAYQDFKKKSK